MWWPDGSGGHQQREGLAVALSRYIAARSDERPSTPGFTLIELLVVIAIISILASLLLPVLVMAQSHAQEAQCANSLKQLQLGWFLYNDDYPDFLAPNSDNGNEGKDGDNPAWVAGTMSFGAEPVSVDESTSLGYLVGPQYAAFGSIGPYTRNGKIYHCPSDKSSVVSSGGSLPRVRSYSMNSWVGFGTRDWLQPSQPPYYRLKFRMGDLRNPGPADTWVFIDEHVDSINDGWFAVDMVNQGASTRWVDLPSSRHNGGAVLSFADGHVQYKNWRDNRTTTPLPAGVSFSHEDSCPNNADVTWLQQRTTGLNQ